MDQDKDRKDQLSERNRKFLERWKAAREEYDKLPPEERARIEKEVQDFWNRATDNGRIQ